MSAISSHAPMSRRSFLSVAASAAAASALASCASTPPPARVALVPENPLRTPSLGVEPAFGSYEQMYAGFVDGGFPLPPIPYDKIDPRFLRQIVPNTTGEPPGTLVVDTANHFLYLVRENGEAIRYGVGLGREGFEWSGRGVIEWKQPWPRWFPPEEMMARQPELAKYKAIQVPGKNEWIGGMEGGLNNPLGARALYIFQDDKDTLFRLHGSPEWWSIGKSVSSGCVRFINQDIIDLYDRVPEKTPIVVR